MGQSFSSKRISSKSTKLYEIAKFVQKLKYEIRTKVRKLDISSSGRKEEMIPTTVKLQLLKILKIFTVYILIFTVYEERSKLKSVHGIIRLILSSRRVGDRNPEGSSRGTPLLAGGRACRTGPFGGWQGRGAPHALGP